MSVSKFLTYNEAITIIEAQEMLLQMQISDYPNTKANGRNTFHKRIYNLAYPQNRETKIVSAADMALLLGKELN